MQKRLFLKTLVMGSAGTVLTACGFKLRGSFNMPFTSIFIEAPAASALTPELITALSRDKTITVITDPAKADSAQVWLRMGPEQLAREVVGSNSNGKVQELRLSSRVEFDLRNRQLETLIAPTTIAQQRDVTYNESQSLAKEAEEQLLYRDIRFEVVQQLLRRLSSVHLGKP